MNSGRRNEQSTNSSRAGRNPKMRLKWIFVLCSILSVTLFFTQTVKNVVNPVELYWMAMFNPTLAFLLHVTSTNNMLLIALFLMIMAYLATLVIVTQTRDRRKRGVDEEDE
jgi:hypothetical protein